MSDHDTALLASRLDEEPPIFRGCSSSELVTILVASIVFWLPVSFLIAGLLGKITMGLGFAAVGVLGTVFGAATWFQRLKRGRPDGYYQQRVVIWLDQKGVRSSQTIRRTGIWDIGRTN